MKKYFHMHAHAHKLSRFGIFHKIGQDPFVDWFVILLITFLASISFIMFSISLFIYINNDVTTPSNQSAASSVDGTLDRADLAKLVASLQDKKDRTALFEKGYQGPPDPSIPQASSSSVTTTTGGVPKTAAGKPVSKAAAVTTNQ